MEKSNLVTTTEHKLTAAQVEGDCPVRLRQIGKEIRERLEKAERQAEVAQNHLIAIDQLLAEAKELCDGGGFDKFRELFCPQLGKSQAYVLLAIADGKKTLAQHRAEERQRKQKTRAKQKAAAANSGTVPEKSGSGAEGAPPEVAPTDAPSTVPEQTAEQLKPVAKAKAPPAVRDIALREFTSHVCWLLQMTDREPSQFIDTGVKPAALRKLGVFILGLADEIETASEPQSTDEPSPQQSADAMKAAHAANDAKATALEGDRTRTA